MTGRNTWNETATDSLSSSESDSTATTGAGRDELPSGRGPDQLALDTAQRHGQLPFLLGAGFVTQTMTEHGSQAVNSETISSGNNTSPRNEAELPITSRAPTPTHRNVDHDAHRLVDAGGRYRDRRIHPDRLAAVDLVQRWAIDAFAAPGPATRLTPPAELVSASANTATFTDLLSGGTTTVTGTETVTGQDTDSQTSTIAGETTSETINSNATQSLNTSETDTDNSSSSTL